MAMGAHTVHVKHLSTSQQIRQVYTGSKIMQRSLNRPSVLLWPYMGTPRPPLASKARQKTLISTEHAQAVLFTPVHDVKKLKIGHWSICSLLKRAVRASREMFRLLTGAGQRPPV
jgi:hypothetical protein